MKYLAIGILIIVVCVASYTPKVDIGVYAALDTPAYTTVTTAEEYVPINGVFTNTPSANFTAVPTPAIVYTDGRNDYYEIDWHASVSADDNGRSVNVGIRKNSVLDTNSIMGTYLKTANEVQAFSGTYVIQLQKNDSIQLVLTSTSDNDVVYIKHFTTTIRSFFN